MFEDFNSKLIFFQIDSPPEQFNSEIMKCKILIIYFLMFSAGFSSCQENREKRVIPTLNFTVSMPEPLIIYSILNLSEGLKGDTVDFLYATVDAGYYRIMDYSNEVKNLQQKAATGQFFLS
jgi:hypothetical protein